MKGILFGGCSFTWGHGLWHYSDIDYTGYPKIDVVNITDAHIKYKDTLAFPTLIANHFNTFAIQKQLTGGSEDITFDFFDVTLHGLVSERFVTRERYTYGDIDMIVIQLSQIHRNRFYFTLDGNVEYSVLWNGINSHNHDKLQKWLLINNLNFDQCIEIHLENQLIRLENRLRFYESIGVKTRLIVWDNLYLPKLKQNKYLTEHLVLLMNKYETISQLMGNEKNMIICNDFEHFINPPTDEHPSKICHRVIADSLIENINRLGFASEIKPRKIFETSKNNLILDLPDNVFTKIMPEKL
jgi:hypothetical protein